MNPNKHMSHAARSCQWLLALFPLLAAVRLPAGAQEVRTDTVVHPLPFEITVTAPGTAFRLREVPFATGIVGRGVIVELPRSVAMDEPLRLVPGVKVDNQANGSRVHVSIRGQGILSERGMRGIKTLLDGIPLNDPTGFVPDFFDIDYGLLRRVEVLRGPVAATYGGSASGGVINLLTENPPSAAVGGAVSGDGGSNGFWRTSGWLGGSVGEVQYRASAARAAGSGYREHTDFRGTNASAKATWRTRSFEITPIIGWTDWFHENPEGITMEQYRENARQANPDAVPYNEFLETERTTLGATAQALLAERMVVRGAAYFKRGFFTEANNRTFNHRRISSPGATAQVEYSTGGRTSWSNRISAGADLSWQSIDEHRTPNDHSVEGSTLLSDETIDQRGTALFLIEKLDLSSSWTLNASLRADWIGNALVDHLKNPYDASGAADFSKATGRFAVSWLVSSDVTLYAAWGQGFLPPATEELAQNPDNFGGFNSHLVPATSECFDVGSRGTAWDFLRYEIAAFRMRTQNDFDRYRLQDSLRSQETFYRNAGSSVRYGVELAVDCTPLMGVDLQLAYTFSDFTYANAEPIQIMMDDPLDLRFIRQGNSLPNCPRHQLSVDLEYAPAPFVRIGLTTQTLAKTYIDGANLESEASPPYTTLDLRIRAHFPVGRTMCAIKAVVRNVADKQYIAFTEPDPGRNSYQPAARREFFVGLDVLF